MELKIKEMLVKDVIPEFFPNLLDNQKEIIIELSNYLFNYIYESFYFNSESEYINQLTLNNYQDMKSILLLIFPYLDNLPSKAKNLYELIYYKKDIRKNDFEEKEILSLSRQLPHTNYLITLLNQYENDFEIKIKDIMLTHLELTLTTLRQVANRLMPNWVNIFPYSNEEIKVENSDLTFLKVKDEKFYNDSMEIYESVLNNSDKIEEEIANPKGIWIGDYYNVIVNHLFYNIVPCKFLLYEFNGVDGLAIGLNFFEHYELNFHRDDFVFNNFRAKFEALVNNPDEFGLEYLKVLLIRYSHLENNEYLSELNKQLDFPINQNHMFFDNVSNDIISSSSLSNEEIFYLLNELLEDDKLLEGLYQMIRKGFDYLKSTFMYQHLIDLTQENLTVKTIYYYKNLTFKNLYNIAKLIANEIKDDLLEANPRNVITNPIGLTKKLFKKLNTPGRRWLNFTRNLELVYGKRDFNEIFDELALNFKEILPYLVQDILLRNGGLNKFVSLPDVTDKTMLPKNTDKLGKEQVKRLKKYFNKNIEEYKNAYYYLTNKKYGELEDMINYNNTYEKKSYFDMLMSTNFKWKFFFTNDWVAQINFFTHFLNQQVMFVTGATGQGKSTQVPKLALYGTKIFLNRVTGQIIGTQPRKIPTRNNIARISEELGIPIEIEKEGFTKGTKIPSDNFNLQFKHSSENHMSNSIQLKLTMMTDGSLLSQLKNNPYLKELIEIDGKSKRFGYRNLYDIVMIDESHEHNPNMDIILSFMRNVLYFNKQIKLFIISATMKDDEPTYRSFYSNINDNLTSPLRAKSFFPFLKNQFINANLLDRRYHISPPGGTTQYKIDENYLNLPQMSNHKKNADFIQQSSYQVILDIIKKNPSGEILFFLTGAPEIKKATEYLNKILPKRVVALPYYSSLNSRYQGIISKLSTQIKSIKNKKDKIHLEWGEDYIEGSGQSGQYDRAVILATNVAEASITIPNLKFIVDNGYAKESAYDTRLNESILTVQPISESSRLQRKGRVGRMAPGEVYFMYPKGARELIRSKLGITQESPVNIITNLIKNSSIELQDKRIITNKFDFNLKPYKLKIGFLERNRDLLYVCNEVGHMKKYHYDNFNLSEEKIRIFYSLKSSGLSYEFLFDPFGDFYIIHPFENMLKRNPFYKIFQFGNEKINEIPKGVRQDIIKLIDNNFNILMYEKSPRDSLLLQKAGELETELELNKFQMGYREGISLLYGSGFNRLIEVILTILLLNNFRSLKNLYTVTNRQLEKILNNIKHERVSSDLNIFIKIALEIKKLLKNSILVDDLKNPNNIISRFNYQYEALLDNKKISIQDYLILNKLKNKRKINSLEGLNFYLKNTNILSKYYLENLHKEINNIKSYFRDLNLDVSKVNKLMEDFIAIMILILTQDDNPLKESNLEWARNLSHFKKYCHSKEEEILYCLIAGRGDKVVFNVPETSSYYGDFTSYFFKDIIPVQKATFKGTEILSSVSNQFLQHYYSFATYDKVGVISILSNIPLDWLISIDPIRYSPNGFHHLWLLKGKLIKIDNNSYQNLQRQIINLHSLITRDWIKQDLWIEKIRKVKILDSEKKLFNEIIKKLKNISSNI